MTDLTVSSKVLQDRMTACRSVALWPHSGFILFYSVAKSRPTTATEEERGGEWALKDGSLFPLALSTSIRWTTALAASIHFGTLQFKSLDRLATPLLWQEIALLVIVTKVNGELRQGPLVKGTQQSNRLACNSTQLKLELYLA